MKAAIIGGGITGLSLAYYLLSENEDVEVELFEKDKLGGVIQSKSVGGISVDVGPDSLQVQLPDAEELVRSIGLDDHKLALKNLKTEIYFDDDRIEMPRGTYLGLPVILIDKKRGIPRHVYKKLQSARKHEKRSKYLPSSKDTVSDFIGKRYGDFVLKNFFEPLACGIYASCASVLGAIDPFPILYSAILENGSITKGLEHTVTKSEELRKLDSHYEFINFEGGMTSLTETLFAKLSSDSRFKLFKGSVKNITPQDKGWALHCSNQELAFDKVFVATDLLSAQNLCNFNEEMKTILASFKTASVVVETIAVPLVSVSELGNVRGLLFSRDSVPPVTAITFLSNKWSTFRNPDLAIIRFSLGHILDESPISMTEEEIIYACKKAFRLAYGKDIEIIDHHMQVWKNSFTQYEPGHLKKVQKFKFLQRQYPNLYFEGSYLSKPGISGRISQAKAVASIAINDT